MSAEPPAPGSIRRSLIFFSARVILRAAWLASALSIFFLQFVGLSDPGIGWFHVGIGVATFALEIPTGILADRVGYRASLIAGDLALAGFFAALVLSGIFSPWLIPLAVLMIALHDSFLSGAEDAYLFRLFRDAGRGEDFLKFQSRLGMACSIAKAVSFPLGAWLYSISELLPYSIQVGQMLVATLCAVGLQPIAQASRDHLPRMLDHAGEAWRALRRIPVARVGILMIFAIGATHAVVHHFLGQPMWASFGFSVREIGWIALGIALIEGIVVLLAPRFWRIGEGKIYAPLAGALLVAGLLMAIPGSFWTVTAAAGIFYGIHALIGRLIQFSVQRHLEDDTRASVMSIGNMGIGLAWRGLVLGAGFAATAWSYAEVLRGFAVVLGIAAIIAAVLFQKRLVRDRHHFAVKTDPGGLPG